MFAMKKELLAVVVSLAAISILLAFIGVPVSTANVSTSSCQHASCQDLNFMTASAEQVRIGIPKTLPATRKWSDAEKSKGSLLTAAVPVAAYITAFALSRMAIMSEYSMQYQI